MTELGRGGVCCELSSHAIPVLVPYAGEGRAAALEAEEHARLAAEAAPPALSSMWERRKQSVRSATRPLSWIWAVTLCLPVCILSQGVDGQGPTNLRVHMGKILGTLNLTWDCNVTEDMLNYKYEVEITSPEFYWKHKLTLQDCYKEFREKKVELHKGMSLQIVVINGTERINVGREIRYAPEGKNGTAAENVSCVAYNTSSMSCTFRAGFEAPDDTLYRLSLRQDAKTESCSHYIKDAVGGHITCRFQDLTINFNKRTYLIVEGSSSKSQIQFIDQWFKPSKTERMNPPRNITVLLGSDTLTLTWETPKTNYPAADACFEYEFIIKSKDNEVKTIVYKNTQYTAHGFNTRKSYVLQMRARQASQERGCDMNLEWGEWSEQVIFGNPPAFNYTNMLVLLAVGTLLISVVTAFICNRMNVWRADHFLKKMNQKKPF
ncbi:granulocyte-macrophage colony-stimulating factor receptor subunit alpha-like isoform X2 [Pleurodeles waltl]|uniref:granulocyte-macrophage colony-stimulating factor receptor subunit alpha-like isoform X2 n=1 Tax=Pleurodeles waltl TaxID=8319 RepID=UPI003709B615